MPVILRRYPKEYKVPFDRVPNRILRMNAKDGLSDSGFRLYLYLHSQSPDFDPTQALIAKQLHWSIEKVKRGFSELKAKGYLYLLDTENSKKKTYQILENPIPPNTLLEEKKSGVKK